MSRYGIDTTMREVNHDLDARQRFIEDREAYLGGRDLDEWERAALMAVDYGALYGMGAHPFMLWAFVRHVEKRDMPGFAREYVETIGRYGSVDFAT